MRSLALACLAALATVGVAQESDLGVTCEMHGLSHLLGFEMQITGLTHPGFYTVAKSKDGFFGLQMKARVFGEKPAVAVVPQDLAMRCEKDVLEIRVDHGDKDDAKQPSFKLMFNGKPISMKVGTTKKLVYHDGTKEHPGHPGVFELEYIAHSDKELSLKAECNKGSSVDGPGGFSLVASATVDKERKMEISGMALTADPSAYGDSSMEGLCGWLDDAGQSRIQAHHCDANGYSTEECLKLVRVGPELSLFSDKKDIKDVESEEAPELDIDKLVKHRKECEEEAKKFAPSSWVERLPSDIQIRLKSFVQQCAQDAMYGVKHDLEAAVCTEVDARLDNLRSNMAENFQSLRCLYSYDNSLTVNGTINLRMAGEEYMARIDVARFRLGMLCSGPCKCHPTPTSRSTPNNVDCEDLPKPWQDELAVRMGLKAPPEIKADVGEVPAAPPAGTGDIAPAMRFLELGATTLNGKARSEHW